MYVNKHVYRNTIMHIYCYAGLCRRSRLGWYPQHDRTGGGLVGFPKTAVQPHRCDQIPEHNLKTQRSQTHSDLKGCVSLPWHFSASVQCGLDWQAAADGLIQ